MGRLWPLGQSKKELALFALPSARWRPLVARGSGSAWSAPSIDAWKIGSRLKHDRAVGEMAIFQARFGPEKIKLDQACADSARPGLARSKS